MASNESSEDDYDFVETPPKDVYCPVTFGVLRKPHQTLCCGNHLSQEAVATLEQNREPCPLCKKALSTVPDKYFQRRVNQLRVCCLNKNLGCEWVGELGHLERHLSNDFKEGDCQFVVVVCSYHCGGGFHRHQLEKHQTSDCPSRPFTCQYCGHRDTHKMVTNEHWSVCEKYPLECPNKCGETEIDRQDLLRHLDETCPLQVIKCEFSYAGCKVECRRQHMQSHLEENVKLHLDKVSKIHQSQTEQQQRVIGALQCKTKQQESKIDALQCETKQQESKIERLKSQIAMLEHRVEQQLQCIKQYKTQFDTLIPELNRVVGPTFGSPFDIEMAGFEESKTAGEDWYSIPFYSHIGGYRMCLRVSAGGHGNGRGTHVSVFIYFACGKCDDQLRWPFRGDITIQLLNQRRDEGHLMSTIKFRNAVSDAYAGRVIGQSRAARGWGYHKFVAHAELRTEDREYLKDDCLKFQITKAIVKSV